MTKNEIIGWFFTTAAHIYLVGWFTTGLGALGVASFVFFALASVCMIQDYLERKE